MSAKYGDDLNEQQKRFCEEYISDLNGTKAAIRAGYSEKGAEVTASKLLRIPKVMSYIGQLNEARKIKTSITAEDVLKELANLSFVDISLAYDEKGRLKNLQDIPENVRRAIASIKVFEEYEGYGEDRIKTGEVREVKFWDKNKSLESFGRHLKLFTDKVEITDNSSLASKMAKARARSSAKK